MSAFPQITARDLRATVEDDGLDGDYSMVGDYPEEADYYLLLGLSRNPPPTNAEIRSAHRNLSLSFHPDKQPPHLRHVAESQFKHIQNAYDTLIDPQKRVVYDILGAEGVRQQWSQFGAMGTRGEAQRQDIGVKAMSPGEFRRWFLITMKRRERRAVESLVSSKGNITLGLDASSLISIGEDEDVQFHIPSPKVSTYGVMYNFDTPLALPRLWATDTKNEAQGGEDVGTGSEQDEPDELQAVHATLTAGIAGRLSHRVQKVIVKQVDGTQEVQEVIMPPFLTTPNVQLGATLSPNIENLVGTKGIWAKHPFTLLKDSAVTFEGLLLPVPSLKASIDRPFRPFDGAQPFNVNVTSICTRSLNETPPSIEVQISKRLSSNKFGILAWSSGVVKWPRFLLNRFPTIGMGAQSAVTSANEMSYLQVGLISPAASPQVTMELDEDEDEQSEEFDDVHRSSPNYRQMNQSAEVWEGCIQVTPEGGALLLKYSRNLFSGNPTDDPIKSEWSSEGYFPMPTMDEARAVRLEVSCAVGLDISLSWTITGTRRVGEHTRLGLGVGIADKGMMLTLTWRRLGQNIDLPVLICPANEATTGATALTAMFPWLAYCAIEFGYIRPRSRKKRRQEIARRHQELKKLLPKKREDSLQAIELMTDQVQRRQAREKAHNGLLILRAEYGYIPPTHKKPKNGFTEPRVIDVTIPVAALVKQGQLVIPKKSVKFQILGFYDPAPLLPKRLRIWYRFQGHDHYVEGNDKEEISCPLRTHLISH